MKGTKIMAMGAALVLAGMLSAPAQARVGHHCVVRLQPIAPKARNGVIRTKPVDMGCFASFAEALRVGSGGAIRLSDDATPAGLTQQQLSGSTTVVPNALAMIGTEYTGTDYTSDSKNYFAPTACAGDDIWDTNYVGDAWNDMFESGKGFGGCDHNRKFGAADFAGTSIVCTPNCTDYGILDMKVSSLRWKP
jgi:hypothetical protein